MKKLVFLIAIFCFTTAFSQTKYNIVKLKYCYWLESIQSFDECNTYKDASTLEIDKNETQITMISKRGKSVFKVEKKELDTKRNNMQYFCVGEYGKLYMFTFALKQNEIRAVYEDKGNQIHLTMSFKKKK